MPATAFCRSCDKNHVRPVGRNCKRVKVGDATATAVSVSGPSIPTVTAQPIATPSALQSDKDTLILQTLTNISEKLNSLDGRVRQTESALADRTTLPSGPSNSLPVENEVQNSNVATACPVFVNTSVVPTTEYLRTSTDIQKQVDARFVELHNAQGLQSTSGKLKSQRGGKAEVPIKRFVAWPQHYVLIGSDKRRPTFDELDPTKFMAGCIKGALDLPEPDRTSNLKYLANLLEDASDFNFDNAKACHAVVLTTMEQDQLSWQDTHDLDRFRRQHTQKHDNPVRQASSNSQKKVDSNPGPRDVLCKFYNDSHCSRQKTHLTKGTWYLHLCSRCRGEHAAKKCPN